MVVYKEIDINSLARYGGVWTCAVGIIFGIIFLIYNIFYSFIGGSFLVNLVYGILGLIIIPLIYGAIGYGSGFFGAKFYNYYAQKNNIIRIKEEHLE